MLTTIQKPSVFNAERNSHKSNKTKGDHNARRKDLRRAGLPEEIRAHGKLSEAMSGMPSKEKIQKEKHCKKDNDRT